MGRREPPWNGAFRAVATGIVLKNMCLCAVRRGMHSIRSPEIVQYVARIANMRELRDFVACNEWLRSPPKQDQRKLLVILNALRVGSLSRLLLSSMEQNPQFAKINISKRYRCWFIKKKIP